MELQLIMCFKIKRRTPSDPEFRVLKFVAWSTDLAGKKRMSCKFYVNNFKILKSQMFLIPSLICGRNLVATLIVVSLAY